MNFGLLVLRVLVGALFAGHGTQKLFGWFGGAGLRGTAASFERAGLKPGRVHAPAAGLCEAGGGILLALGLLTPLAAAALIAVMTAAAIAVSARNGVWITEGGFEYNAVLATVAFALVAVGPGAWSIDHALGLDLTGVPWALAALVAGLLGGTGAVLSGRVAGDHGHLDSHLRGQAR